MTETIDGTRGIRRYRGFLARADKVVLALFGTIAVVGLFDPEQVSVLVMRAAASLSQTLPFILFAVGIVAYLAASGAEGLVARAFTGRETRMIFVAALVGGVAPFCSCEIIPFIAALLALGAPLSAIMALWLSSPLMDPAQFAITAGAISPAFAVAKTVAAISVGLMGGFAMRALASSRLFDAPLKDSRQGGCCAARNGMGNKPVWQFWQDPARRAVFSQTAAQNGRLLLKWLALAYVFHPGRSHRPSSLGPLHGKIDPA